MLFFAEPAAPEPSGLILSPAEADRQRAQRRYRALLARDAAARLLGLERRPAAS